MAPHFRRPRRAFPLTVIAVTLVAGFEKEPSPTCHRRIVQAIEFVVGGQPYDGPALVAAGVALKSVPAERALDEARAYADAVAKNDLAAMAGSKSMIRSLSEVGDFRERLRAAQRHGRG